MKYERSVILVDPKDHKELKKKLKRLGISLSSWVREKTKQELQSKWRRKYKLVILGVIARNATPGTFKVSMFVTIAR